MTLYEQESMIVEMRYKLHLVKNTIELRNISDVDLDYSVAVLDDVLADLNLINEGI